MRKKPDYTFKAAVLESDLPKVQRQDSIIAYFVRERRDLSVLPYNVELVQRLASDYREMYPEAYEEADKINHAHYERTKRLRCRVLSLLERGQCVFLTLTFTDDVLNSTTAQFRRLKVVRFLKEVSDGYVANIDFGEKNGREHYHAIVRSDLVDYSLWSFGSIDGIKIRSNGDVVPLSKYISKLTNHAIKATTKRNAVIYSR